MTTQKEDGYPRNASDSQLDPPGGLKPPGGVLYRGGSRAAPTYVITKEHSVISTDHDSLINSLILIVDFPGGLIHPEPTGQPDHPDPVPHSC